MICKNCGQEIPDNSVFCTHCGAALSQEDPHALKDEQPAGEAPLETQTPVQPVKKAKKRRLKLIAVLAVIVIVLAGAGTLAYNSQPALYRMFKGEKAHFTMLMERMGDKYTGKENSLFNDVNAKITHKLSYDLKQLEALGLPLDINTENSKLVLEQLFNINSEKDLMQFTQQGSFLGAELPEISALLSSGDMGIYIQDLTKGYISISSLLNMSSDLGLGIPSSDLTGQSMSSYFSMDQLNELQPLLEKYKDRLTDIVFDSDNVQYQSGNKDLGFSACCYEITLAPDAFYELAKAILTTLNSDDELKLKLCELISPDSDDAQIMLEQLNSSLEEVIIELEADKDALIQELETQLEEISVQLWFDGQNNPLGAAFALDAPDESVNQDFEFTILDYKHGKNALTLIELKADNASLLEYRSEAEINGSKKKGSIELTIEQTKLLEGDYELNSFEIRGIELYEGEASFEISGLSAEGETAAFKIDWAMQKQKNGLSTEITPSVKAMGASIKLGKITSELVIEELDGEIESAEIIDLTEDNYEEMLTLEQFAAKMEEFAQALQNIMGGFLPSDTLPII